LAENQEPPQNNLGMQESLHKISQKHKNDFIKKSFGERFYYAYCFCYYLTYALALVSIGNAVGFFVGKFESAGLPIAITIGLVITFLLEYAKTNLFFNNAVIGFYATGRTQTNFVLFGLFLLCLGASIYTSVLGAGELVKYFDKRQASTDQANTQTEEQTRQTFTRQSEKAEREHKAHIASLKTEYATKIATEQQGLTEYKYSVTWEGKINMHNPTTAYTITSYQQRISELQKSLQKELDTANLAYQAKTAQASTTQKEAQDRIKKQYEKTTNKNQESFWNWFYLALFVAGATEALIIVCNWFVIYFQYYISIKEPAQVLGIAQTPMQQLAGTFQSFLYHFTMGKQVLPNTSQVLPNTSQDLHQVLPQHLPKNKIGFNRDKQDLPEGYKPPLTLKEALQEGIIKDTRLLTKIYGVNINQVSEARQALKETTPPKTKYIITDLFAKEGKGV
jgi:hypothetical protein